jgi:mono/diheme cytochrome c family protein
VSLGVLGVLDSNMRAAAVSAVIVVVLVAACAMMLTNAGGFSARTEPTAVERFIARAARRWAVPRESRNAVNPVAWSDDAWAEARAHFADHCATCHGNDGSGDTTMGRSLYPRAPDMRQVATQQLTDGELYWIIENGVRLTGMPAWGSGGGDDTDTWKLVHFIRHLNHLSPEHLEEMEALNPRSPADLEEERADQQFLAGHDDHQEKAQ